MDPPSYGRGPTGETWKLEDDLYKFVRTVTQVMSEKPEFVLINSYTTGLSPATLTYMAETLLVKKFGGNAKSDELGLKVSGTNLVLPCGAVMRWDIG